MLKKQKVSKKSLEADKPVIQAEVKEEDEEKHVYSKLIKVKKIKTEASDEPLILEPKYEPLAKTNTLHLVGRDKKLFDSQIKIIKAHISTRKTWAEYCQVIVNFGTYLRTDKNRRTVVIPKRKKHPNDKHPPKALENAFRVEMKLINTME